MAKGKEEEIAGLLSKGVPPVELVRRGYARGTVYKVKSRVPAERPSHERDGREPGSVGSARGDDPEAVALQKALRVAELERQLEEATGATNVGGHLAAFEVQINDLYRMVDEVEESLQRLTALVEGSPLGSLRNRFECPCGSTGLVAGRVFCTSCGLEQHHGWWPPGSQV